MRSEFGDGHEFLPFGKVGNLPCPKHFFKNPEFIQFAAKPTRAGFRAADAGGPGQVEARRIGNLSGHIKLAIDIECHVLRSRIIGYRHVPPLTGLVGGKAEFG